jgi:PAS domain S-box-containing protein
MKKKDNRTGQAPSSAKANDPLQAGVEKTLRERAEKKLSQDTAAPKTMASSSDLQKAIHEFEVYQIELTMQNDELRRTQSELEELRALYFDLYDLAPVGYVTLNEQGVVLAANLRVANQLGEPRSVLVSQEITRFILKQDQDILFHLRQKLLETGQPQVCELRMMRKGQSPFWARLEASVTKDESSTSVCRVVISDITESKNAEEKLRESEERFRAIFNSTFQFTGLLTPEGNIIEANRAALEFAGITLEEIKNRFCWDAPWWRGNDERVQQLKEAVRRAAKGEFVRYEMELQGTGNMTMLVDFSLKPVFDAKGNVTLLVPEGHDISDLKQAQSNLQKEHDLLASITETSPVGITFVNREGQIVFANHQAEKILGLSRDIITRQTYNAPVWRITDENGHPFPEADLPFRRVTETGNPVHDVQHAIVWPDGRRVLLSINAAPLLDSEGRLEGMVAAVEDITERKRTEAALHESNEKYRALIESSPDVLMRFDKEGRHLFASENVKDAAGIPAALFIGKTHRELDFPEPLCSFLEESIRRVFQSGAPFETEFTFDGPSGAMVFNWRLIPELDTQGNVRSVLSIGRDITAHRHAEQEYRTLFTEMLDGFALHEIICDDKIRPVNYRFLAVNPAFERLTGLKAETLIGRTVMEALPGTEPHWIETYGKVALTGEPAFFENYHAQLNKHFEVMAFRPAPNRFACIFTDITGRKLAEAAIRESEEKFSTSFEKAPILMIITSIEDGTIMDINAAVTKLSGFTREEAIGKKAHELGWISPQERFHLVQELKETDSTEGREIEAQDRNGNKIHCLVFRKIITISGHKRLLTLAEDITDRKLAQDALRESEAVFRTTFTQSPVGAVIISLDKKFIRVNRAFCDFLGYSENELIGKTISDITDPDDFETGMPELKMMMEGKLETASIQKRYLRRDGKVVWGDLTISLVRDASNTPLYFLPIIQDITGRKHAEEILGKKDALLANLASQVPGMLFQFKRLPDGTYTMPYASEGIRTLFGFAPDEVRDDFGLLFKTVLPEDHAHLQRTIEASARTLSPWVCEFRVRLPGESVKWIMGTSLPEKQADGSIVWSGYDLDITESKLAQDELKSSHAKLHALWGIASLVDADSKTIADHILESITKMTASEYGFYGFVHDNESVMTIHSWSGHAMDQCKMADQPQHFPVNQAGVWGEALRRRKSFILNDYSAPHAAKRGLPEGHVALRNLMVVPHFFQGQITALAAVANKTGSYKDDDLQQITAFLNSVQMIVERRRAEEEKEKLQAQLQQARKIESIGRLAGGVAHDFNNMLGVILGRTQMALDQMAPTHPLYDDLEEIQRAAERSADITRQLLAFARKQTVSPLVIDLNKTVSDMKKMLQRLIGENIDLTWMPGRDLWPVRMDPGQIDQILANLCVNARDAIEGTGRVTITTDNVAIDEASGTGPDDCSPGNYVLLTVSDDGCGISPELHAQLFEPFFTTKEVGKGTGLGLSTVYGIVKQNRGYITVESEPGQGTTFKIYLPRHMAKENHLPEHAPVQPAAHGHETILLVEDEPAILRMTTLMLERLGYVVLPAGRPGEAIHLAREHAGAIHLLITDVVMPEMNGRDLAKNLLSVYPDIKRLFMSGYTADVIAHQGVLDEGVHFIQKPFRKNELAEKVREALDH